MQNIHINWAINTLKNNGYLIQHVIPETIQSTPWSDVYRFATDRGFVYLKIIPPAIALEAKIITLLYDQFHANVPKVIAYNTELNCFLMKDAGRNLREILKKQFDAKLLCKAVDQFTSLQIAVADHINIFIDMGVPDWRLDKLPDLYAQLLAQKDLLIADGLSEIERMNLEKLQPKASDLCKKLSEYSIKQSIVQPDFNENNTLIDDTLQNLTIIDLGEIVISHPFFSLFNFLQQIKKHHKLTDEDDTYLQVMDACFENYMNFESKQNLLEAFALAQILWNIYGALAQYRLMDACGKDKIMSFQHGRLSDSLRAFMTACIAIHKWCSLQ